MAATEICKADHEPLFRPFVANDQKKVLVVHDKSVLMDCDNEDTRIRLEELSMPSCSHSHSQSSEELIRQQHEGKLSQNQKISEKSTLMHCTSGERVPSYRNGHSHTHTQIISDELLRTSQNEGKSLRNRQIACTPNAQSMHAHSDIVPGLLWRAWHKDETYSLLSAAQKCFLLDKAWHDPSSKWHVVVDHMKRDGHCTRTDRTARGKFLVITREFKYLKRWKVLGREPAYESMTSRERSEHGLPRTFEDELYRKVQEFYDATGLDDGVHIAVNSKEGRVTRWCAKGGVAAVRRSTRLKQLSKEEEDTDGMETSSTSTEDDADDDDDGRTNDNCDVHEVGNGHARVDDDLHVHHKAAISQSLEDKIHSNYFIFGDSSQNISQQTNSTSREKQVQQAKKGCGIANAGPVSDSSPNGSQQTNITSEEKREAKKRHVTANGGTGMKKKKKNKMNEVMVNHINATASHLAQYIQAVKMNIETLNLFLANQ